MLQKSYVFGLGSYLIEAFKFWEDQKKQCLHQHSWIMKQKLTKLLGT